MLTKSDCQKHIRSRYIWSKLVNILIMLGLIINLSQSLTLSISSVSPDEIEASATYNFGLQPSSGNIPSSAIIKITFPSDRYSTITDGSISGCLVTAYTVNTCTGSNTDKSVTLNITGASSFIVIITIPSITNPSTTDPVSGFGAVLNDTTSGNTNVDTLASSGALFTPSPKSLTSATITVASGHTNK